MSESADKLDVRVKKLKSEADVLLAQLEANPKMPTKEFDKLRAQLLIVKRRMIAEINLIDIQTKK